jgi:hypothetical protein
MPVLLRVAEVPKGSCCRGATSPNHVPNPTLLTKSPNSFSSRAPSHRRSRLLAITNGSHSSIARFAHR